ncbi:outer membrane lipid asymmetry maintenance protein MlaD [Beggiatoa leptomitoformis]|uniref:Outer membrane lipid asymmetry maintenance protein MlaD n=1 Tax=Beggiatoa leptomitoformis TaxID=288004 RepID=A0A2N9YBX5_9GAMM|nr:outer membrane lipid asymmetry maintenance protein MlaD [Beggiatoa leptomitoformis]ALG66695.1 outer membrane lipid asymmetry maintenance protein MlaD [Beggiatoa leptomitoformis]AUI67978.1 outer membrane lipid asymmetry maintenance protein MlaD [Beggiatoa leptomitoformis]
MYSRTLEIWVGIFVTLGFLALLLLTVKVSNLGALYSDAGYLVTAKFQNIGGLKVKAPVKISGVTIGRVTDIQFDNNTYKAVATLRLEPKFDKLPADTSASIFTSGLLGEQYIGLEPGGDTVFLTDKSEIYLTQSAMVLEQLIGQFLYRSAASGVDGNEKK